MSGTDAGFLLFCFAVFSGFVCSMLVESAGMEHADIKAQCTHTLSERASAHPAVHPDPTYPFWLGPWKACS